MVLIFFFCIHPLQAQISSSEVKSALILRFCENVSWPKPPAGKFHIACFSENKSIYAILKANKETIKIHGVKIEVVQIEDISELRKFHAVYFSGSAQNYIKAVIRTAREHNVLLITDNYSDPMNIMINMIETDDKVAFKVNVPNLTLAGFTISPNLLINGGSTVDLKAAYEKFETQLRENKHKIEETKHVLESHERQLLEKDKTIKQKESEIKVFTGEIEAHKLESSLLKDQIRQEKNNLSQKSKELQKRETELQKIYSDIDLKKEELADLRGDISSLKNESGTLKTEIHKKNSKLSQQLDHITTQKNVITLGLGFITMLILAAFALSRLIFLKRRHNKELEKKVALRTLELQLKNDQYLSLFNFAPAAIMELDFSEVKTYIHSININSEDEYICHLNSNPGFMKECFRRIKYLNANSAVLELYDIKEIKELFKIYAGINDPEAIIEIGKELTFLISDEKSRKYESVRFNNNKEKLNVLMNWIDISDMPKSYNRVLSTTIDVTRLRNIEKELRLHQENLELMVKERTEEIASLNEELKSQNEELNQLNIHLEEEVIKRTVHLKVKNEQLATYAFKNGHNVRGSLARILGLIGVFKLLPDFTKEDVLNKIDIEATEMDVTLKQISDELHIIGADETMGPKRD